MDTGENSGRPTSIRHNLVNPAIGLPLDDDDDSLNSPEDAVSIEARLEKFRDNWKRELKLIATSQENDDTPVKNKSSRNTDTTHNRDCDGKDVSDMERQATELFEKGSSLESSGKLYDAVAYYRRATQLVPDIESRIYFKEKANRERRKFDQEKQKTNVSVESEEDSKEDDLEDEIDLILKFNSLNIDDNGKFFICQPSIPTRSTHFSDLPYEVVLYILRWVVSDELDMRSLETFGQVCRGFYILSRESEIWKLACLRMWYATIIDQEDFSLYNDDWRTMFLEKPRVNVNGIYISKASYVRQGEASFQDVNYRPCYLVEYYRYLRFFPKGVMMMLNTPDDPHQTLPKLRSQNASNLAIIRGHYRIHGSRINAVLKSRTTSVERITFGKRGHKNRSVISEKDYNISLDIRSVKGSRNNQLVWSSYSVVSKKNNEFESKNTFDIVSLNKFPPFWFSRVKSYGLTSNAPLM